MASKKPEQKPWTKFEKISYFLLIVVSIIFFPVGVVIFKEIFGLLIVSAIFYPLLLFIYIPIIYIACRKKLRNKIKKKFKEIGIKGLIFPENKFGRLVVNVLFIAVWFYITFLICEELIDVPLFIGWSLLLVPIFVYTRFLWFEKSRNRIFYGIPAKLKFNLKQLNSEVFNTTSNADELKKYSDLRDQGIITEEEFQAKKKKLLDL